MKKLIVTCSLVLSACCLCLAAQEDDKNKEDKELKNDVRTECCCGECACKECTCETDCLGCRDCRKNDECKWCEDCDHEGYCCDYNDGRRLRHDGRYNHHRRRHHHDNDYCGGCCRRD